jgi:transposase
MAATRYFGMDIHKRHVTVAALDAQQQVVYEPKKVSIDHFPAWAHLNLDAHDEVAMEATINAWEFHDQLLPLVADVSVANCHQLRLISASAAKTDKHDALVLAKLLAANLLPTVWVPPQHVRDLRNLTRHRSWLIHRRTALKNRLHALLHRHNLAPPEGNPFTASNEAWWDDLPCSPVERLQLRHDWETHHHLDRQIAETEAEIAQLSIAEPWQEEMTFLMQIPGVGLYTGMTILAAIGDIERFPSAQQLVGYAGLGARVHDSGDTHRGGKISKRGRRELRTALVACAWVAVRWSAHWRHVFERLAKRIGKQRAITAVARKLLVVIWHVLTKRQADRYADPEAVARSFMRWSERHHLARSQNMPRIEFVRARLDRLDMCRHVASFRANGRTHYLPEAASVAV